MWTLFSLPARQLSYFLFQLFLEWANILLNARDLNATRVRDFSDGVLLINLLEIACHGDGFVLFSSLLLSFHLSVLAGDFF